MGRRYHNKEWLVDKYDAERMSTVEIADECGVSATTINDWLQKHDIPRRSNSEAQQNGGKYTSKSWLSEQYTDNKRSMADIADECGVTPATILKWLRRFDIETRGSNRHQKESPPAHTITPRGYEVVSSKLDGEISWIAVHQLVAIAHGADPHKVFSDGEYQCHHKNGCRVDNRPDNIELLSGVEHANEHWPDRERAVTGEFL